MIKGCFSDWTCAQVTLSSFSSADWFHCSKRNLGLCNSSTRTGNAIYCRSKDDKHRPWRHRTWIPVLGLHFWMCDSVQSSLFTFLSLVNPLFPSPLPESIPLHTSCGWMGTAKFLLSLTFLDHLTCNCPKDGPNWSTGNLRRGSGTGD